MTHSSTDSAVQRDSTIEITQLDKEFRERGRRPVKALSHVNLTVPNHQFVALIGPSGCGKSSMFNIIAGLDTPTDGDVLLGGRSIVGEQGNVGYMLQKDLLLPWRTILNNIIIGLELADVPKSLANDIAAPLMDEYGLGEFKQSYPNELSGGMRQRAALLRTILFNKDVILLDEPFGKLDAQTRAGMQEWLLDLWNMFQKTVIFVTHDIDEAIYLSDRVVVMSPRPGRIIDDVPITIPRPRQAEITMSEAFLDIKRRIRNQLTQTQNDTRRTA